MAKNDKIIISMYKINLDFVSEALELSPSLDKIPGLLVNKYNEEKLLDSIDRNTPIYTPIISANDSAFAKKNNIEFYKKNQPPVVTYSWSNFFRKENIELGDIPSATPSIVCFVTYDNALYAFTTGSSATIFEPYVDQTFPIEVAKRITDPAIKGGKKQSMSGEILASDIYFRHPTRISQFGSQQDVWKAFSGNIIESVKKSAPFKAIFGTRKSTGVEIKSSIKINAKINDPRALMALLEWLCKISGEELNSDQKMAFSSFDAIRPLSKPKDRIIINDLTNLLVERFFDYDNNDCDFNLSHIESSSFINAEKYSLRFKNKTIKEWDGQLPDFREVSRVVSSINDTAISDKQKLEKFQFYARYQDTPYLNLESPLLKLLNGELQYGGTTYYLLSGRWFKVESSVLMITQKQLIEYINTSDYTSVQHAHLGLSIYDHSTEKAYNCVHTGTNQIVGDQVFYNNIELADILYFGDKDYIDIIHNKRYLNGSIRDLSSQIRNAIEIIENDLNLEGQPALNDYYTQLEKHLRLNGLSRKDFITLFTNRRRRYVFGYIYHTNLTPAVVEKLQSSLAKYEIVSLIEFSKRLGPSASLNLVWIPTVQKF